MWLSSKLEKLLNLNTQVTKNIWADLQVVRAERDLLKTQLAVAQSNFEWVRLRVNQLEYERAGLMEKAYDIKLPAPEIVRTQSNIDPGTFNISNLFDNLPLEDAPE